tara:strand:- start:511 stop:786 length:276 start_codon:yes stop_codon:yes gene_type:complete
MIKLLTQIVLAFATLHLGVTPTFAAQENQSEPSAWLVLTFGNGDHDGAIEAIEMRDLDQCEEQGAIWASSERIMFKRGSRTSFGFECLEGK